MNDWIPIENPPLESGPYLVLLESPVNGLRVIHIQRYIKASKYWLTFKEMTMLAWMELPSTEF